VCDVRRRGRVPPVVLNPAVEMGASKGEDDVMHDWVVANENMAKVLASKGYHYQFVFARNAGHVDRAVKQQTLPEALEYIWQGDSAAGQK
jgi:hypothetical protein